ncbi:MAG: XrtA/PEP-CTERM system exopolysaccharide export protein [Aquabacterium sp.]
MRMVLASTGNRLFLAVVAAALTAGCASVRPDLPPAPRSVDAPDLRYKIGPLDTLSIVVWRNPELSGAATVRPDGFVSMPLVGELRAAGKTPAELAADARAALSKLVLDPVVNVVLNTFQGVYSEQIRIVGEAARPQAVSYRREMTLLDVMIQVGGLTDFADGNAAILIRGAEGGRQYSIRLRDLLKRGDISANVAVMPGDIVMVPQSWF